MFKEVRERTEEGRMNLDYCVNYTAMKVVMLMLFIMGVVLGYVLKYFVGKRRKAE